LSTKSRRWSFIRQEESVVRALRLFSIIIHAPRTDATIATQFRHNSITMALAKECDQKLLYPAHRLDRLTSGLLIFAKKCASERERERERERECVCV
jgi:23S rRNA-/tRNA-specific pseudouridylate synthase